MKLVILNVCSLPAVIRLSYLRGGSLYAYIQADPILRAVKGGTVFDRGFDCHNMKA